MKLLLRGHHLLCLKGFQGYGYDEAFTQNMTEINLKRKHPQTTVSLTDSSDDICKSCPNLVDGLCRDEKNNEKITEMDRQVLKRLEYKTEYNSKELFDKIDEMFNSRESVSRICFNCLWHKKCLFYQKLSNNR